MPLDIPDYIIHIVTIFKWFIYSSIVELKCISVVLFYNAEDFSDEINSYSSKHSDKITNLSHSLVDDVQGITVSKSKCFKNSRQLTRNRSLIDVQSQRLHQSLLEEIHKKRMFKTVGSVENIGFRSPFDFSTSQGKGLSGKDGANSAHIARKGRMDATKTVTVMPSEWNINM